MVLFGFLHCYGSLFSFISYRLKIFLTKRKWEKVWKKLRKNYWNRSLKKDQKLINFDLINKPDTIRNVKQYEKRLQNKKRKIINIAYK